MDLLLIELILWAGLLFLLWALKDGLGRVETDIESLGLFEAQRSTNASKCRRYVRPEEVLEPIGSYKDALIYRYATIGGYRYQFDRVSPTGSNVLLKEEERCVEPGLVYVRCDGAIAPSA